MAKNDLFRVALFGGFNKEDVQEYMKTLENEIEAIKVLHQKEKNELLRKIEEGKTAAAESEELEALKGELEKKASEAESLRSAVLRKEEEAAQLQRALDKSAEEHTLLEEELKKQREDPADERAQQELAELETENRRLEKQLEEAEKRLLKLEAEAEQLREEKEQEILDRETIAKVLEDAYRNADLIREDGEKEREAMLKEAVAEAEKQREEIVSKVNSELEAKGIQLMAAKHKIEHYMKEVNSAQQGLYNIYMRMNRMMENMPLRLDDYWKGDQYKVMIQKKTEEPQEEKTE
ncbi:coiled-coil domain-containing protein [Cuneatibacter caecimuris]|uniref:DivIVA protein n=1 Tax=Cuneatibacter caecimuris TaxID=1796618 RepID=A0A4Q7P018_9FIRM|nr:hypothetical protein [Cuneatibacter caecimuris]RZS92660.1 hypothetical protein EV209_2955 [Cuneatibacter caecimuris]